MTTRTAKELSALPLMAALFWCVCSCVHELPVTDHSFEFEAVVTYDGSCDEHRLTLTRKSGLEDNEYRIAFNLDGEDRLALVDGDGRTHEGPVTERFSDVSARTYTLSGVTPGEHTLNLDISTEEYRQAIAVTFTAEDFSFLFACRVMPDEKTKENLLEVTLEKGSAEGRYIVSYTIDNTEPRKTYEEDFSKELTRRYRLTGAEPGEHTINVIISTPRHVQETDIPFTVDDHSFEVKADIEYDSEDLSHVLFLSLLKGSRDDTYTVSCLVDGGHSVKLTDTSGHELPPSFSESFRDATVRSYRLSRAGRGRHTMKITVSTDCYRQEEEVPYEVEALPFSVHMEADTASGSSVLMLSLTEGDPQEQYWGTVRIDGKETGDGSGFRIDFADTPICRYTLPLLRPGRHEVELTVTDGYTDKVVSCSFTEPVRHPYVDILLSHDKESGKHVAAVGTNPYGVMMSFTTTLTITGESCFCDSQHVESYFDISYTTKSKTMSDKSTAAGIFADEEITLIDRDALATKMTGSYEDSNIWKYFYDPGGSEDAGREWWYLDGTEKAFYVIKEESLEVVLTAEKVTGVTLRVENRTGPMRLNGKEITEGSTSIAL